MYFFFFCLDVVVLLLFVFFFFKSCSLLYLSAALTVMSCFSVFVKWLRAIRLHVLGSRRWNGVACLNIVLVRVKYVTYVQKI